MSQSSATSVTSLGKARAFPVPPPLAPEKRLTAGQWGMLAYLFSDVALFSTLIVTYVVFMGRDSRPGGLGGPTPVEVLSLPLMFCTTAALLASSFTIHLAERALRGNHRAAFVQFFLTTIALGVLFLAGTVYEWTQLIGRDHLTISRNLFGTTFYTLVGCHAAHVAVGVIIMLIVLALFLRGQLTEKNHETAELVSWYWHFVDGVWIVVVLVVYVSPHVG